MLAGSADTRPLGVTGRYGVSSEAIESLNESDESEVVYEVCDLNEAHPQWTEIREGVNYATAWRSGRRAALRLRAVLSRAGVPSRTAFTHIRSDGSAVVCVELEQPMADALADLINGALCERK